MCMCVHGFTYFLIDLPFFHISLCLCSFSLSCFLDKGNVIVCTPIQQSLALKLMCDRKHNPHRTFGCQGIYLGIFCSSSSYHPSLPHQAYRKFQVRVLQCDYPKAHGTRDQGAPCQWAGQQHPGAVSTPLLWHSRDTLAQPRSYTQG